MRLEELATPKEGDLQVWNAINPPTRMEFYPVNTPEQGYMLIEMLALSQLKVPGIVANAFGLNVFRDGDWEEWNDEDGQELDEHMEQRKSLWPCHKCGEPPKFLPQLVEALGPIVHFIDMFDEKPLRQAHDRFYGIHDGTKWEADLRLSNFRVIRDLVKKGAPAPKKKLARR